ncbi:winged helix-turn-helix transcriptional regulator [Haliangium ochraceum]|uniref:Transcriptional regulator, HxlR family n=1 Tax=Haliangium ochraceum (strain DSM 14365 / JCM 11303 / SMP-2) TaxID=502025 RepID=D0LSP8_HALO1|nr:winged helix-turn-helix transcriptional regulator [Haliangium ochraceum]ACY17270.1 transcriptional regulator, HxlR family [Haliangium ochraceum DSM 14365]
MYFDGCAAAHALDLVGERWALLVMRELLLGPKRFGDLRAALPGISANVLTQRLAGLEAAAILRRRKLPPPAAVWVYELSEWGLESEEIFQVMGRWGARSPFKDPAAPLSATSMVVSLRTMFDGTRVPALRGSLGFRFGDEEFRAALGDGAFTIERGPAAGADAIVRGDQNALAAVVYGGVPLAQVEAEGGLELSGDRALLAAFVTAFPLPEKAPGPDAY